MSNDYRKNNDGSKRHRHLTPCLYACIFPGYTDLVYFEDGSREQIERKVDCSLLYRGREFLLEEKLISQKWSCIYCETESCSKAGIVTDGWMRTCEADYLVYMYTTDSGLDIYVIRFIDRFKSWFWDEMKKNPHQFEPRRNPDKNESQGRLVPINRLIRAGIPMQRYFLTFDGHCQQIELNAKEVVS